MTVDTSFDPRTGGRAASTSPTTADELEAILASATMAADILASTTPTDRGRWLGEVADALQAHGVELARVADWETALGIARLEGEVVRTAGQIRFYSDVAREGTFLGATIDEQTATTPAIGRANVPLGPVAVFGASNFPFAFSIFGNDTAAAIAAGCSVVVKAHPAHLMVSQRVFDLARDALKEAGAPDGTIGIVFGHDAGVALVKHPSITAVAFTGSQSGGMSLWRVANEREVVIPVYAEMGTVNPVVVTPAASDDIHTIANGFAASFTLGNGQFCTKPGLILVPSGIDAIRLFATALEDISSQPVMLTKGISEDVVAGVHALQEAGATIVADSGLPGEGWSAQAVLLSAPLPALHRGSRVLEECFGPVAVIVEYDRLDDAMAAVDQLQGALAASIMIGDEDPDAATVLDRLHRRVGRVVVNDWPTGVAYTWAQQHGGPWPATSNAAATSVGAAALDRFVRPIAFQGLPDKLLPAPLKSSNPWGIPRRVNGAMVAPESS